MFAVLRSDMNSFKSGLLHLIKQKLSVVIQLIANQSNRRSTVQYYPNQIILKGEISLYC
jgi:hypothetical protein